MKIEDFIINIGISDKIEKNAVGIIKAINGDSAIVYFVGKNETLRLPFIHIKAIDIEKTGKGFDDKICNICHILKKTEEFDVNQTDAKGQKTTRPSCKECRKGIDGVSMQLSEKKRMEDVKPPKNSVFTCPICEKRTIAGITANLVRDHDHDTGLGREWICDSCNTGLGRFKDNINFLQKVIDYLKKFKN